jgi:hypothetical protein
MWFHAEGIYELVCFSSILSEATLNTLNMNKDQECIVLQEHILRLMEEQIYRLLHSG